jgi:hypothetical protein
VTVPTLNSAAEFVTNGVTTNFPFFFKFLVNEDLVVTYVNPQGVSSVLTFGTQYTVNGAGSEVGGSIVTTSALAGPGQLVVTREMDAYQLTSLRNQGKFLAETHEDVFDRLTMLIQQGFSIFKRALTRPLGRDYFYAEDRRIASVKDPEQLQDAATLGWTSRFVGDLISDIEGPINNAANIFYLAPDGTAHVVQDLSGLPGSGLVGHSEGLTYPAGTVGNRLKALTQEIQDVLGVIGDLDASDISYTQQTGAQGDLVSTALNFLGRSGKEGIFFTPASLGHRAGRLAYRITAGGRAELISDLRKYYPAGAFVDPYTVGATGLKAYFVKPGGNNASAGTDWSTALASVTTALAKSDVDVVFVAAGVYVTGSHLGVYAGTRHVSIQAVGGDVVFVSAPAISQVWSSTAAPNVFKRTTADAVTGVVAVDYRDEYGMPYVLTQRASVNDVIANNGSWFYDGAAVNVSLPDGAAPVTDRVLYYLGTAMRVTAPNVKFHQRGISYVGGTAGAFSARTGNAATCIVSEQCKFTGQPSADAYQIKDVGISIAIDCIAGKSGNDCFNYHFLGVLTPHFIEVNCVGVEGMAAGTGNGSSCHEDVIGIRIGCDYSKCGGSAIAEVNDASSYNVGCTGIDNGPSSTAYGVIGQSNDKVGAGVRIWLHACSFGGNAAQDIAAKEGAQIFVRDTYYASSLTETGGTITAF